MCYFSSWRPGLQVHRNGLNKTIANLKNQTWLFHEIQKFLTCVSYDPFRRYHFVVEVTSGLTMVNILQPLGYLFIRTECSSKTTSTFQLFGV